MLYTKEDLPKVIEQIELLTQSYNLNPNTFEITERESDNSIRVASYTDDGGFMVRLFADHDIKRLDREIKELYGQKE